MVKVFLRKGLSLVLDVLFEPECGCSVDQKLQIGARVQIRSGCKLIDAKVTTGLSLQVNFENLVSLRPAGRRDVDHLVEPARSEECGVKPVRNVRRAEYRYAS